MTAEATAGPAKIATAGWTIPRAFADAFPSNGSGLERCATRFNAVEINSTLTITHEKRLVDTEPLIDAFRREALQLGDKLGPLLVQLPPSLAYNVGVASPFLRELRARWPEAIALEPRHPSWFEAAVNVALADKRQDFARDFGRCEFLHSLDP